MKDKLTSEIIIPAGRANAAAFVVFMGGLLVLGLPFSLRCGSAVLREGFVVFLTGYWQLVLVLVCGMVLHELIHAATWLALGRLGLRAVSFGFSWRHMAPHVALHSSVSLRVYGAGVMMPGLVLGLFPLLASLLLCDGWLFAAALFFTAGAGGDLLCLIRLSRFPARARVTDHPDSIGFIVYHDEQYP